MRLEWLRPREAYAARGKLAGIIHECFSEPPWSYTDSPSSWIAHICTLPRREGDYVVVRNRAEQICALAIGHPLSLHPDSRYLLEREVDPDSYYIRYLATTAKYRGRGLGLRLMNCLFGRAMERGFENVSTLTYLRARSAVRLYTNVLRMRELPSRGYGRKNPPDDGSEAWLALQLRLARGMVAA